MADVSHELGSLRLIVDSPLSSKVAMFNQQVNQHQQAQLLNPFSGADGRSSPKPTFSKDQYGKPLAGSLTEMRGQKANMHVMREMLELCQIIDSEGYDVKDEPTMRVIPFGELFNIYNYISDKCVGILLRARKYKLVEFEGEMLFQRRDDNVPIFLLKPIQEIRRELNAKIEDIKRASSPAPPQATSVLLDKSTHQAKLQEAGLAAPRKQNLKSRTPSPAKIKAPSPAPEAATTGAEAAPTPVEPQQQQQVQEQLVATTTAQANDKTDINNNEPLVAPQAPPADAPTTELPTIVIEASAVYVASSEVGQEGTVPVAESATAEAPASNESAAAV